MKRVSENSGTMLNTPTSILWVPEGDERERDRKIFEEIIAENFPNMVKETLKSKKYRAENKINPRRYTLIHI